MRRGDTAVLAGVTVYALLIAFGDSGSAWTVRANDLLYGLLAGATIWQLARVTRLAWSDAERVGWLLLTLSAIARIVSGYLWSAFRETGPGGLEPEWLMPLKVSYLAFGLPALLLFPMARWHGRDAARARLDALTVLLGSVLVGWYFGIGPLLRLASAASAPIGDRIAVFGDAFAVLFAALLHLRAASDATRAAARLLLLALALRLAPDILIWRGSGTPDFSPFGLIDATWFLVWALQWAAARLAEVMRTRPVVEAAPDAAPDAPRARYVSGFVPHGFLLAAIGVLLVQVAFGRGEDVALFTVGSAALALLLVRRQGIELDERDRLAQRLEREGARFEALLRHAYDGVVMFDRSGALRYASPATLRTFGEDIVHSDGKALAMRIHPDDRAALLGAIAVPPPPGAKVSAAVAIRLRALDRHGRWRSFEGHLHDHRADPLVNAIVLNGIDRTREARLSEGLAEAQPLEALGVLAGGLAHDLNNILTVVASHAELLDADAELDARARDDVRAIRAASDRAQSLTRGLLTLSRRKQGPVAAIAVSAAVREAMSTVPGATLEVAAGHAISVLADPSAVAQVVDGLLEAARDDSRLEAIHITVSESELDEEAAGAVGVESRLYVRVTVGARLDAGPPVSSEDAVRMEAGNEWDLPPSDLALLIALAASRELGGTVRRERQGDRSRYVALLPAVHQ